MSCHEQVNNMPRFIGTPSFNLCALLLGRGPFRIKNINGLANAASGGAVSSGGGGACGPVAPVAADGGVGAHTHTGGAIHFRVGIDSPKTGGGSPAHTEDPIIVSHEATPARMMTIARSQGSAIALASSGGDGMNNTKDINKDHDEPSVPCEYEHVHDNPVAATAVSARIRMIATGNSGIRGVSPATPTDRRPLLLPGGGSNDSPTAQLRSSVSPLAGSPMINLPVNVNTTNTR
jgi:hypothetical protein